MGSKCRFCQSPLNYVLADLGLSPVSNHFRDADRLDQDGQTSYPLKALVCESCWLVQLSDVETPPHFFEDYAYFSSFSSSWLAHAKRFATKMTQKLKLDGRSLVVEIASNDGYLLQHFDKAGIGVLGIEPSKNVASYAKDHHGIDSLVEFFGSKLGQRLRDEGVSADLIVCNNVLAHVPDIGDFVAGLPFVLAQDGTLTIEFPHLLNMLRDGQFDTIYHEHYCYLSLLSVEHVLSKYGLSVYGVEKLKTHGGSLRVFAKHKNSNVDDPELSKTLRQVREEEAEFGLHSLAGYIAFKERPVKCKLDILSFLVNAKRAGKTVCGYGAPAKGNTMLNYAGIGPELLAFTTDLSPQKQGKFLPGVNIPVFHPDHILKTKPDYVLILPWNLKEEISEQLSYIREWGGEFLIAIPELEVF